MEWVPFASLISLASLRENNSLCALNPLCIFARNNSLCEKKKFPH